eukprot:COSAG02_NODE_2331_length_9118_cov_10.642976_2_plen_74_part_00
MQPAGSSEMPLQMLTDPSSSEHLTKDKRIAGSISTRAGAGGARRAIAIARDGRGGGEPRPRAHRRPHASVVGR